MTFLVWREIRGWPQGNHRRQQRFCWHLLWPFQEEETKKTKNSFQWICRESSCVSSQGIFVTNVWFLFLLIFFSGKLQQGDLSDESKIFQKGYDRSKVKMFQVKDRRFIFINAKVENLYSFLQLIPFGTHSGNFVRFCIYWLGVRLKHPWVGFGVEWRRMSHSSGST